MAAHPPFLKHGSVIGITCPSGYVSFDRVAYSVSVLEKWGFKVKLGKTICRQCWMILLLMVY